MAEIKELQKRILAFVRKYNLEHSPEISALDLVSEVGEIAKEILKSSNYGKRPSQQREEMKAEIGDAFYSLINLANTHKIDLEEALNLAFKKYEERLRKRGAVGSKR